MRWRQRQPAGKADLSFADAVDQFVKEQVVFKARLAQAAIPLDIKKPASGAKQTPS